MVENPLNAIPIAQPTGLGIDLPCFFCGYNLRTLAMEGVCTECGRPVQDTFFEGWLIFADKHWLGRLRRGITIILWTLLASLVAGMLSLPFSMTAVLTQEESDLFWARALSLVLWLGYAVLWLWSVWLITSPEPRGGSMWQSNVATWIRGLSGIGVPLSVLAMVVFGRLSRLNELPGDRLWQIWSAVMLSVCVFWTAFLLLLIHGRRLARRDLKKGLRKLMSFLVWGYAAIAVPMVAWMAFVPAFISAVTLRARISATQGYTTPGGSVTTTSSAPFSVGYKIEVGNTAAPGGATSTMPAVATDVLAGSGKPAGTPTTMPTSAPTVRRFRRLGLALLPLLCGAEVFLVAWLVSSVVALFWLRNLFTKAIQYNVMAVKSG